MSEISVVICAHTEERWDDLVAAVESIRAQATTPYETIIVSDRNPRLLERARALEGVKAVENVATPGLGGARNSGLAASAGSIVAFLDDDAVASERWLEHLLEAYTDDRVLAAGGSIEPMWVAGKPRWFPDEFAWTVGCTYRGMPEVVASVRNLIGCNMSYRREVLEELGGFRLGYGCDETDLCIRLRNRWPEGDVRYLPEARVFHRVPPSRTSWRRFQTRCFFEGGSKAVVSWLVGSADGLASERVYATRTLPIGVARGVADAVLRHDPAGLARAAAIVGGLVIAVGGYVHGKLSVREAARRRGWTDPEADRQVLGSYPEAPDAC